MSNTIGTDLYEEQTHVTIIGNTKQEFDDYGHHYGSELCYITKEQIQDLLEGKIAAIAINEYEYTLFIALTKKHVK